MPKLKVYRGWRDERDQPHVTVNNHPLRHVKYHTDAFDWGLRNDGAADLALSMLANYFRERPNPESKRFLSGEYLSWRLHQDFMTDVTSTLSRTAPWVITSEQIALWLELHQRNKP